MNDARHMWKLPKTWAPFAPSKKAIAAVYKHVDFQSLFNKESDFHAQELEQALQVWSKNVETAVSKAIALEHKSDPTKQPRSSLHASYRGRCNFQKISQTQQSSTVKSDRHGGYTPPSEILTLRCRLKIRQVRRLKTLCRRYKTLDLDDAGFPGDSPRLKDAYAEWRCILAAKGYGSAWGKWILSFDVIPAVSLWLPAYDVLETMTELTKHDCDHACRDESNKSALAFKTRIHIDNHDDYSKMSYKIIRSKESQPLSGVPVERCFSAKLLRASVGHTALLISDDFIIPPHANLKMDDADLKFIRQEGRKVFFKHLRGNLPSSGTLKVSFCCYNSLRNWRRIFSLLV